MADSIGNRAEAESYLPALRQCCTRMTGRTRVEASFAQSRQQIAFGRKAPRGNGVMQIRRALTALAIVGALIGSMATSTPAAASDRLAETIVPVLAGAAIYYGITHAQPVHYYGRGNYYDPAYYYFDKRRGHWRARNRHRRHDARQHRRHDRRSYSHDRGHRRGDDYDNHRRRSHNSRSDRDHDGRRGHNRDRHDRRGH